jgi:imidazolonepropionase-like amidohydrolase
MSVFRLVFRIQGVRECLLPLPGTGLRLSLALSLLALSSTPPRVEAQDVLIRGAAVYTMAGPGVLERADVLIRDGKIVAVGPSVPAPGGVRVISGEGHYVLPGLIDAHSHIATQDERGGGSDRHEQGQRVNTGLRILDSVNPQYKWLTTALEGGVTTILVTPGSNATFGGQIVVIKTPPKPTVEEMLLKVDGQTKMSMAATMGTGTSEMREWLQKGREYLEKWERWEAGGREGPAPTRDLQLEGIGRQLKGEVTTHIHAQTAIEMQYALKMAREFGLRVNIEHAFDGWKMVEDIKASGVTITFGPMIYGFANEASYTPGILVREGVRVALTMDSASDFEKHHLHHAQMAVRYGMAPMEALRSVTIVPAEILGVDQRVGSLEVGKDGDVVILDGDPMSTFTHVLFTIVDGEIVYERGEMGS